MLRTIYTSTDDWEAEAIFNSNESLNWAIVDSHDIDMYVGQSMKEYVGFNPHSAIRLDERLAESKVMKIINSLIAEKQYVTLCDKEGRFKKYSTP